MNNEFRSIHHSFDIDLAEKYGVKEAILIHHFQYWIRFNKVNGKNLKEGKTWMYQTIEKIQAHFPYFTISELSELIHKLCTGRGRRSKKELEFEPVLIKGEFNENPYDHSTWYAFVDEPKWILAQAKIEPVLSQNRMPLEPKSNINILNTNTKKKEEEETPPNPLKGEVRADALTLSPIFSKKELPREAEEAARYLLEKRNAAYPDMLPPKLFSWASDMDKLNRLDKRSWEAIKAMIDWIYEDAFWVKNILSACKLREQWDKISAQMKPAQNKGAYLAKNRALAQEVKSCLKNSPKFDLFVFGANAVIKKGTDQTIPYDLNPKEFESEILRIFNLERS